MTASQTHPQARSVLLHAYRERVLRNRANPFARITHAQLEQRDLLRCGSRATHTCCEQKGGWVEVNAEPHLLSD